MAEYTPDKPKKIRVEWSEHPDVQELDDLVRTELDRQCERSFFSTAYEATYSINDLKVGGKRWVEDQIEVLQKILKKIDALPDSDEEEIEVEDVEHSGS